jgi:hypothetical protein
MCKSPVKIVVSTTTIAPTPKIEDHDWSGEQGDLVDRLHCVQYTARCPMGGQSVRRLY